MHWERISGPEIEPLSVAELQQHLRVPPREDETHELGQFIAAAREDCEEYTWRQFMPATWRLELAAFPSCRTICLPRPPLLSLSMVRYRDPQGDPQELDPTIYELAIVDHNPAICLLDGRSWPETFRSRRAVTVIWQAGWPVPDALPRRYRQAVLLLAAEYYRSREASALDGDGRPLLPPVVRTLLSDRATHL